MDETTEAAKPAPTRKPRKRRIRSPHPGVKIKARKGRRSYRAAFRDPDLNEREVWVTLDPLVLTNDKLREEWAIKKAHTLAKRRMEIENGGARATGLSWKDAFDKYRTIGATHLTPGSLKDYNTAMNVFTDWAKKVGVLPDTLTRGTLTEFRSYAFALPKRYSKRGGKRGERGGERERRSVQRSAASVNGDLRVLRTVLGWLHETDRLPKLPLADISRALKRYTEPDEDPVFLAPSQLQKLFKAALAHDVAAFRMTRTEKEKYGESRDSPLGTTAKYTPIAPLVMAAVLSGMRLDEMVIIDWRTHVDLDALDFNENMVGEIKLRALDTKTKKKRRVVFDVSPLLRELFVALREANDGRGSVFGIGYHEAEESMDRLREAPYDAPSQFTWQVCRSTCSTYLVNSPGIYGSAAPFHESKQLGHSQEVAEKSYTGLIRGIRRDVHTLEAAMQIEKECKAVIEAVRNRYAMPDNVVRLHGSGRRARA